MSKLRAPLWLRRLSCMLVGHKYIGRVSQYGRPELRLRIRRARCKVCWHRQNPKVIKRSNPNGIYYKHLKVSWPLKKWD